MRVIHTLADLRETLADYRQIGFAQPDPAPRPLAPGLLLGDTAIYEHDVVADLDFRCRLTLGREAIATTPRRDEETA